MALAAQRTLSSDFFAVLASSSSEAVVALAWWHERVSEGTGGVRARTRTLVATKRLLAACGVRPADERLPWTLMDACGCTWELGATGVREQPLPIFASLSLEERRVPSRARRLHLHEHPPADQGPRSRRKRCHVNEAGCL